MVTFNEIPISDFCIAVNRMKMIGDVLRGWLKSRNQPERLKQHYYDALDDLRDGKIQWRHATEKQLKSFPLYCEESKYFIGSEIKMLKMLAHCKDQNRRRRLRDTPRWYVGE